MKVLNGGIKMVNFTEKDDQQLNVIMTLKCGM